MDALLKTGQEKSTQLFGLTSQVTEEKPKVMGFIGNSQSSFLMIQCYPIQFKVFKIEVFFFFLKSYCHEFMNKNIIITFNY